MIFVFQSLLILKRYNNAESSVPQSKPKLWLQDFSYDDLPPRHSQQTKKWRGPCLSLLTVEYIYLNVIK
jgi:hypothetical protein